MRMILKVKQEEFQSEGNALFEKYKVARTEDSLTELKEEKQSSEKSVINYVSKSFEPKIEISQTSSEDKEAILLALSQVLTKELKIKIQALKDEINGVDYYLKMLFTSDTIVTPNEIDLNGYSRRRRQL